jgi:hypothetical protein
LSIASIRWDPDCCSRWWPSIISFLVIFPSLVLSILLSTKVGFDVSNYQPPEANLERRTKLLGHISLSIPILSGIALIISLVFTLAVTNFEARRPYHLIMSGLLLTMAGFFLGVGGDIFVVQSGIDEFILPYRVIWAPKTVWASEVEFDFRCCGFDATTPPAEQLACDRSLPFCPARIAAEYDHDVIEWGKWALALGCIDAVLSLLWGAFAIWLLWLRDRHDRQFVPAAPSPKVEDATCPAASPKGGEGTYPAPYPGAKGMPGSELTAPLYAPNEGI